MTRLGELGRHLFYLVAVAVLWSVCKILFQFRWTGRENIPREGAILVAHHRSYWDIPLLAIAVGGRRRIHFVARKSLIKENPFVGLFVKIYAIPIDRESFNQSDYRRILEAIQSRKLVGIFPEGTTKDPDLPRIGVARFAERTEQRILPVKITAHGPYPPRYPFRFPRITVRIGRPFHIEELAGGLPPGLDRSDRYRMLSLLVMEQIEGAGRDN